MIRVSSPFGRAVSVFVCFGLINLFIPYGAFAADPKAPRPAKRSKRHARASRAMTAKEMRARSGKDTRNPYVSGSGKWAVIEDGIDVESGNFSTSATDLSFEGGYGIPINVTRSYSSNQIDDGPFGYGWTLSVDLRQTVGGLLKSPTKAVRSVPTHFKERPMTESDPNVQSDPTEAVVATDAGGKEETVQRDLDGILTSPGWDKNLQVPIYEYVTDTRGTWKLTKSMTVTTPDGTVYQYDKEGDYPQGTKPWNDGTATPQSSNLLKVTSVTDRQGNQTVYHYDQSTYYNFQLSNGTVEEHPLTSITMPGGHALYFTWGAQGTRHHIVSIQDYQGSPPTGGRQVTYTYGTNPNSDAVGDLIMVTSPAGKATQYNYTYSVDDYGNPGQSGHLLCSITDPRGLVTSMSYHDSVGYVQPYGVSVADVFCYKVVKPNGRITFAANEDNNDVPVGTDGFPGYSTVNIQGYPTYWDVDGLGGTGTLQEVGVTMTHSTAAPPELTVAKIQYGPDSSGEAIGLLPSATYQALTGDLLEEDSETNVILKGSGAFEHGRYLDLSNTITQSYVTTTHGYNFLGSPLWGQTAEKQELLNGSYTPERDSRTEYAYWGASKYFQQKATRSLVAGTLASPVYRYSMTDYNDNGPSTVGKGLIYRVYDPRCIATFSVNFNTTYDGDATWRADIAIPTADAGKYAAQMQYDAQGRATDVWKLNHTDTSPWHYVQTHTDYGDPNNSDGFWGNARMVTEDYGSGTDPITNVAYINRITQTPTYEWSGRALRTIDGMGRQFDTNCDLDGRVQSVTRTDNGMNQPIVTYTYGTTSGQGLTALTNGVVTSVVDGLSGVQQNFSYNALGAAAAGQVGSVTEINGTDSYTVSYIYAPTGDVSVKKYHIPTTPGASTYNDTEWQFSDYLSFGASGNRVPRTLTQLASTDGGATWNPTSEEFDYAYDNAGRLIEATFAMSPQTGQTGYSPSWPAASRGRAFYQYDAGGRLVNLRHWWDVWSTANNAYVSTAILGNSCIYDPVKNQKIQSNFWSADPSTGQFKATPDRSENYQYDPNTGYLTQADYGDGLASQVQNWTYDAAGNRASDDSNPGTWSYDALNRMAASPGLTYTNNLAGDRLTRSDPINYGWDAVHRMTSYAGGGMTTNYAYGPDGLRVSKTAASSATTFRYDGPMGIEDEDIAGGSTVTTQYAIGPRGVEGIVRGGVGTYPIYDAHGNATATLSRSIGGTFTLANQRTFGAWGEMRQGAQTGDPKGRHCGNIGHKQDDESSLVYMRARYEEPATGRFISEDPSRQGWDYFSYCSNNPISLIDQTGNYYLLDFFAMAIGFALIFIGVTGTVAGMAVTAPVWITLGVIALIVSIVSLVLDAREYSDLGFDAHDRSPWNGEDSRRQFGMDGDDAVHNAIDDLKTYGTWSDKILACELEAAFWLGDIDSEGSY